MEVTMPTTDTHTDTPVPDGAGAFPSAVRRFGRVPACWLEDPGIGVDELAVLTALAVHAGRDGVCVVRQRTLAGLLRRSREWVCRVLARLCQPSGFVEKEYRADRDGWNLACRYRLPDLATPEDCFADSPGESISGISTGSADGAARNGVDDPVDVGGPLPAAPAMPQPVELMAPAPEAVSASADVTGGAHQEQTPLNKDS